jgi:MFS family permease
MGLMNFHRSTFSVLLPSINETLQLDPSSVGVLQSSALLGYLAGQIPCGMITDRIGGDISILWGCFFWSLALAASALGSFEWILFSRLLFGLFTAVCMPAVSSFAAQTIEASHRALTVARIYSFFSLGGFLGMCLVPLLSLGLSSSLLKDTGDLIWPLTLGISSILGLLLAPFGLQVCAHQRSIKQPTIGQHQTLQMTKTPSSSSDVWDLQLEERNRVAKNARSQVVALCVSHGVIGWGFFLINQWLPLYLSSLGIRNSTTLGLLSCIPLVCAAVGTTAWGSLADRQIRGGKDRLGVRKAFHGISTVGCAFSLVPLALASSTLSSPSNSLLGNIGFTIGPAGAIVAVSLAQACYSASFGGHHAYVQDNVDKKDAGMLVGLTNSVGIVSGLCSNMTCGVFLSQGLGYPAVFALTALVYLFSFIVFSLALDGRPIAL